MRPLWTGGITFGLIYIPVKLYSATKPVQLDLDLLSKKDKSPIRYARIDTKTGEEISWKDVVKGFEYRKGDYVVLDAEDFDKVDIEKSQNIEITSFVNIEEIDPIYFDTPYYLEPDAKASKLYALLRDTLKKTNKAGVAEFVMRNRERLCVLKPEGNLVVLNQMRYEEEVRPTRDLEIPGKVEISKKELDMATKLVEEMADEFNIEDYKDDYIAKLKKLIENKAKHKTVHVDKPEKRSVAKEDDLTELLLESLRNYKYKAPANA